MKGPYPYMDSTHDQLWNITILCRSTVAFTYLKVKSAKCLCLLPVVLVLRIVLFGLVYITALQASFQKRSTKISSYQPSTRLSKRVIYIHLPSKRQTVAVWCSGNALVLINAVAQHRAQLVLGWVTAFG